MERVGGQGWPNPCGYGAVQEELAAHSCRHAGGRGLLSDCGLRQTCRHRRRGRRRRRRTQALAIHFLRCGPKDCTSPAVHGARGACMPHPYLRLLRCHLRRRARRSHHLPALREEGTLNPHPSQTSPAVRVIPPPLSFWLRWEGGFHNVRKGDDELCHRNRFWMDSENKHQWFFPSKSCNFVHLGRFAGCLQFLG